MKRIFKLEPTIVINGKDAEKVIGIDQIKKYLK